MNKKKPQHSLRHTWEAHFIFMEVSNGIYKVVKDRLQRFQKGQYVTSEAVISYLNTAHRVAICSDEIDMIIHANFDIQSKEETTNAEMKGLLENA